MKKLSALLLAFAMMLTMLSVASADDVQVIRMWSNDQHDQSVIKEKIEAFNATIGKENGIAVEYTVYGSDYYSTLDVAVTSKEGPDIFKCNKIGNYAEAGTFCPGRRFPRFPRWWSASLPTMRPATANSSVKRILCRFA